MSLLPVISIRKFPFHSIGGKQESKLFQVGALHTNTQSELLSSCTAFIFQPHKDPLFAFFSLLQTSRPASVEAGC